MYIYICTYTYTHTYTYMCDAHFSLHAVHGHAT